MRSAFVLLADLGQVAKCQPKGSVSHCEHTRAAPEHFPCSVKSLTESVMNHWGYRLGKAQAVKSTHVIIYNDVDIKQINNGNWHMLCTHFAPAGP